MNKMRQEILAARLGEFTSSDGVLCGRFRFDEGFVGFAGHFPGYPLLPAVVQVVLGQILAETLAEALAETPSGAPLAMASLDKAKFVREVRPGDELLAECRRTEVKGRAAYEVRLSVSDEPASSFILVPATEGALA